MELVDTYFSIQKKIYDYFGYEGDWEVIPIDDRREMFWSFDGFNIFYAETLEKLKDEKHYYSDTLYNPRFFGEKKRLHYGKCGYSQRRQ
jgi:hypothetical protein